MSIPVPVDPKIYHIVHVERLSSIVTGERLFCDAEAIQRQAPGTTIGMSKIKERPASVSTISRSIIK